MTYLDSDFLVNYFVVQNKDSNRIAVKKFEKLKETNQAFISLLALQEVSFVLSKLRMETFQIEENLISIQKLAKVNFDQHDFKRAQYLASKIGFQNINDCLHLAIAEQYCKELYTFNKNDFEKLKNHTNLKINIL